MWSKLKKKIKENIVPELQGRIDIHFTRYHSAPDEAGEVWIVVDKKKIAGGSDFNWHVSKFMDDLSVKQRAYREFFLPIIEDQNVLKIMNLGMHYTSHIVGSLENYINTNYDLCLKANNPIYKAFAIVDRRLGKRRFYKISITDHDHDLVKAFYSLRKGVFDINYE